MDMYCTNTAVWTVWRVRDGDSEDSCVLHFTYDGWVVLRISSLQVVELQLGGAMLCIYSL